MHSMYHQRHRNAVHSLQNSAREAVRRGPLSPEHCNRLDWMPWQSQFEIHTHPALLFLQGTRQTPPGMSLFPTSSLCSSLWWARFCWRDESASPSIAAITITITIIIPSSEARRMMLRGMCTQLPALSPWTSHYGQSKSILRLSSKCEARRGCWGWIFCC